MKTYKQLVLVILDGFGVASSSEGNTIYAAMPKNLNFLVNSYPSTTLQASGPSVGLPWGEPGNSEVGHLNLGAGRIVSQDLPRISSAIANGEFFSKPALAQAVQHVQKNDSSLHLVGLVSDGGVHSSEEHLYALLGFASEKNLKNVYIHMFTDGRDTAPKTALESIDRLTRKILEQGVGRIATVTGRFYAMDRGRHWETTEATYKALVLGQGEKAGSAVEAIEANYEKQIFDETIPPTVVTENGEPIATISEGDSVIFFNFRPDRMVQLARAFTETGFDKFSQDYSFLQNMFYVTMTQFEQNLPVAVAFPPQQVGMGLAETVSKNGLTQFHIAESEKYAHVTSFFNGGKESLWPLEEREIITSPKQYKKRYEDVPEMSASQVAKSVVDKLRSGTNFILVNFANPDMVGHTGNKRAGIKAIQAIDESMGEIYRAVMEKKASMIITADHGNIEEIIEPRSGRMDKEHSLNPVPFILIGEGLKRKQIKTKGYLELPEIVPEGVLSDVSPTVLELMGIPKPKEMSAVSLLSILLRD